MLNIKRYLMATALLVSPSIAIAQTRQPVSIQGSPVYVAVGGGSYHGMKGGPGGEVQIRLTPNAWSFGLGLQSTSHNVADEILYGNATLRGLFFEPRYVFSMASTRLFPYASGRAVFIRQSTSTLGIESHAYGSQMNVGGGVLVRIASNVNLDLGSTFGWINLGKPTIDRNPDNVELVDSFRTSGQDVLLRLGVAVGLGR
ncbi:MAG: hypothetical protein ABIT38_13720 [Gemmatimonadaceae bacterium]